jgi:predicted metalloprotease
MRRFILCLTAAAALTACGTAAQTPATGNGPWTSTLVAGLPVTQGPSGLRPGAPPPRSSADGGDGGPVDRLALSALDDVQQYWQAVFPQEFGRDYTPIRRVVSFDSTGAGGSVCGTGVAGLVNAFYCAGDDTVAWDRGRLLPDLTDQFGLLAVVTVVAHEAGHAVQFRLGAGNATSIVKEQQADCYTGAFFRSMAQGRAARFEVSTGPGLNQVLATLFSIRDPNSGSFETDGAHGNAFDRVAAFQLGFGTGPGRCRAIDQAEITGRITQRSGAQDRPAGDPDAELPVDATSLAALEVTVRAAFQPLGEARIGFGRCPDPVAPGAVAYCPGTDTVGVDTAALDDLEALGDFAAFAEIVSRFTLSVQRAAGLPLTGLPAAQRTACLTGAWAATVRADQDSELLLEPGDLDEAVAEMLGEDSRIAADQDGLSVPSGFARVQAFRDGFTGGVANGCAALYR